MLSSHRWGKALSAARAIAEWSIVDVYCSRVSDRMESALAHALTAADFDRRRNDVKF